MSTALTNALIVPHLWRMCIRVSLITLLSVAGSIGEVSAQQRCVGPQCPRIKQGQPGGTGFSTGIPSAGPITQPNGGGPVYQGQPNYGGGGGIVYQQQPNGLGSGQPPMSQACVTQVGVCPIWQPLYSQCGCQDVYGNVWPGQAQ
jgi:hypothetical protein